MSKKKLFLILTILLIEEKSFSIESDVLHIHYQDRAPYFINNSKKIPDDGILYHLTKKILQNANIPYEFNEFPLSKSAQVMKKNNENVCISYALEDPTRNEFVQYSLPYFRENPDIVVFRKNDQRFSEFNTIKDILKNNNLIFLIKKSYSYGIYVDKLLLDIKNYDKNRDEKNKNSQLKITNVDNLKMLKQINSNEADYVIISLTEYNYLKNSHSDIPKNLSYKTLKDRPVGHRRFFMCSKMVSKETMDKLNQSILKIAGKL